MGTLRFLLAMAVIVAHTTPLFGLSMVGGATAVQTFFMISGFYMALILDHKYTGKGSYRLFLTNRFLRIFPLYWIVLILSIAVWMTRNPPSVSWHDLGMFPFIFLAATNILIIGQDLVLFLKFSPSLHMLIPTKNFWVTHPPVHSYLFVPQAWSISIELLFYLIAPLLSHLRTKILLGLAASSLLLRLFIYAVGLHFDPWTYRLFPLELIFFIFGMLGLRAYKILKPRIRVERTAVFTVCIAALTLFYQYIPLHPSYRQPLYFLCIFCTLPFLFCHTNHYHIDRLLGELSYPMYILHYLIITVLGHDQTNSLQVAIATVASSLVVEVVFLRFLEKLRQRRVKLASA